jgi:hypothetical protein
MQVHQIERDSTLQIPLDAIDGDLLPDVPYPTERDVWLGDGLINALILLDTVAEVSLGLVARHAFVIWIPRLYLEGYISSDDCWVITVRFEKDKLKIRFLGDPGLNLGSSLVSIMRNKGPGNTF